MNGVEWTRKALARLEIELQARRGEDAHASGQTGSRDGPWYPVATIRARHCPADDVVDRKVLPVCNLSYSFRQNPDEFVFID